MNSAADPGDARLDVESTIKGSTVWIILRGEADAANLRRLDAALDRVVLDDRGDVCIDLTGLEFIDVAALRHLTAFADRVRQRGHEVRTLEAPPVMREALRVLDGHDRLGLA